MMSKKAIIIIIAAFALLLGLIGMLFARISALEQSSGSVPASAPLASAPAETQQSEETTQEATTVSKPTAQNGLISVTLTTGDSWGVEGAYSANVSAQITNKSEYTAKDWSITIPVENGTKIDQIWNGTQKNENNVITITSADYNKEIPAGQSTDIGFIITSAAKLNLDSYSAKASVNGGITEFNNSNQTPTPVQTPTPAQTPAPTPVAVGNNGVAAHGQLKVSGTQLTDKDNNPVVLKGMSSHGLAWFPQFTNKYSVNKTKEYGANVFRAAMYTEEYGGYTTGAEFKAKAEELLCGAVDTAIGLDMYAIIDWHILSDGSPSRHKAEAAEFFDKISKKYAGNPAVIYEICNEPNGASWSGDIKPYANEIIPIIRKNSPNAVIIVGTNTWSQDVDEASKDRLQFDNVMYSLHFYAGTHKLDNFKNKIETALGNGCAIFVTEWGTTMADGSNGVYLDESQKWLDYLKSKNISYVNWSLSDKAESSAALKPGANSESFTYDDLSESGKFVFDSFSK